LGRAGEWEKGKGKEMEEGMAREECCAVVIRKNAEHFTRNNRLHAC